MDSRRPLRSLLALLLILPIASAVQAGPVTFTGSSGTRAASVTFAHAGGGLLSITLTNTSMSDVLVPAELLNAVFFDVAGNTNLTRVSAILAAGSTVLFDIDGQPAGGIVGGEWAYKRTTAAGGLGGTGIPSVQVSQKQGIGSSGYDIFGPGDLFPGPDLDSPASPNGMNYGLLSAGDNPLTGNPQVTGGEPLIKNSVVFTLSGIVGLNDNTDLLALFSNIRFQYGTALDEGNLIGTPEGGPNPVPVPAGVLMMGLGGICLAGYKVRRNRKVAKLA